MPEQNQTELKYQPIDKKPTQKSIQPQQIQKDDLKQKRQRSRDKDQNHHQKQNQKVQKKSSQHQEQEEQNSESYPEQQEMMNVLGFSSFKTSKHKDHTKSAVEAVFKNSSVARKYRQYMNRPGNFNRKLDAI